MEFASALNFYYLIGFVDHLQFLKNLHSLYGLNYIHTMEGMQESGWMEGLYCKDQDFRNLWPVIIQNMPRFHEGKDDGSVKKDVQ